MIDQTTAATFRPQRIETLATDVGSAPSPIMHEELLPFTVRIVSGDEDLSKAVQIRHSAYSRHLPEFAETLRTAEAEDTDKGVVVLLAESKLDGSPLGSMRIQTNEFKPLGVEESVLLPDWLRTRRLAEASRLGVTGTTGGRLVTTVLFKAFYLYCQHIGTEWMVITGRAPIDRQYERLLYEDVFPGKGFIPLHHVGDIPHRVMTSSVETAEDRWYAAKHPLFDFAFRTHHPDIKIGNPVRRHLPSMAVPTFPSQGVTLPM